MYTDPDRCTSVGLPIRNRAAGLRSRPVNALARIGAAATLPVRKTHRPVFRPRSPAKNIFLSISQPLQTSNAPLRGRETRCGIIQLFGKRKMPAVIAITLILLLAYSVSLGFALRVKDRWWFFASYTFCTLFATGVVAFAVGWSNSWAGWSDGSLSARYLSHWISMPMLIGGLSIALSGLARSQRVFWAFQVLAYLSPIPLFSLLKRSEAAIFAGVLFVAFGLATVCLILGRYKKKDRPNLEGCIRPERSGAVNTTGVGQSRGGPETKPQSPKD